MTKQQLIDQIKLKSSFLCVGLDVDLQKVPAHFNDFENPVLEFNKCVVDATKDYCVAYKPNIAFYECLGSKGWDALKQTMDYIPKTHFTIADAKRGDIGNTSTMYAKTFFNTLNFDAVTVAPYMGEDSVLPFLEFENKWVILLGLTSNKGSENFQFTGNPPLYEQVISQAQQWGNPNNLMFVIGATHPQMFEKIRKIAPNNFYLVPGVGAQGGNLQQLCKYGMNNDIGLLVNSSRGIIYAGKGENAKAGISNAAKDLQQQMENILTAG